MAKKQPGMMIYFEEWDCFCQSMTYAQLGRLVSALIQTAQGEQPDSFEDDATLKMAYALSLNKLQRDSQNYANVVETRRQAGRRSGEARRVRSEAEPTRADQSQTSVSAQPFEENEHMSTHVHFAEQNEPTVTPTATATPTVISLSKPLSENSDTEHEQETEREKPSVEEVLKYAQEADCDGIDAAAARRFIAAQAAKGWRDSGGRPIRNWRTWFDGWYARHRKAPMQTGKPAPTSLQYDMRTYSDEELSALTGFMEGDDPDSG